MKNPTQDVQAILHGIVNDLEKTSSGLTYIFQELQKISPRTLADMRDLASLGSRENKPFYDGLRQKIDALVSSERAK